MRRVFPRHGVIHLWTFRIEYHVLPWWRHQIETFSVLLVLCVGNSPVTGEFPSQRPVTQSVDVFFHLRLNERLRKQSWGLWFETPSCPLWRHNDAIVTRPLSVLGVCISSFFFTRMLCISLFVLQARYKCPIVAFRRYEYRMQWIYLYHRGMNKSECHVVYWRQNIKRKQLLTQNVNAKCHILFCKNIFNRVLISTWWNNETNNPKIV